MACPSARARNSACCIVSSAPSARRNIASIAAKRGRTPVLLKIAPDMDDAQLETLMRIVSERKLSGVVATNTTVGRTALTTKVEQGWTSSR